jgi:hypothetical protein
MGSDNIIMIYSKTFNKIRFIKITDKGIVIYKIVFREKGYIKTWVISLGRF